MRHRIRQLIDAESPDHVLSDDTIVEKLREPGSTSPGEPSRSIARRCGSPRRCGGGGEAIQGACTLTASRESACRRALGGETAQPHRLDLAGPFAVSTLREVPARASRSLGMAGIIDQAHREADHAVSRLGQEHRHRRGVARARQSAPGAEATAKYFDGGFSGHVTIGKEGFGFRTECVVHLDSGIVLEADALAADAYASADQAALRLEKRLRRYKRRLKDHQAARVDGQASDLGRPRRCAELCHRRSRARR